MGGRFLGMVCIQRMPSLRFGCNPSMDDEEIRDFIEAIKKDKEQQQHIEMTNDNNSNDKGDLE